MKYMKIFLIVIVIVSFMGVDAMAQPKSVNASSEGTVKLNIIRELTITVVPKYPFPTKGHNITPGETQSSFSSAGQISGIFTIDGEPGYTVDITHNGNGKDMNQGGGLAMTAVWYIVQSAGGALGLNNQITGTANSPLDENGEAFVKFDITSISAANNAQLGVHRIEYTLTASYHY